MQGAIRDDRSRTVGSRGGLVRRHNSAGATFAVGDSEPGAAKCFESEFSSGVCAKTQTVAGRLPRGLGIGMLLAMASACLVRGANADVVPYKHTTGGYRVAYGNLDARLTEHRHHFTGGQLGFLRGPRDITGSFSMANRYPWWEAVYFNEGDNVEWIYGYLESQYTFLDDTLYKLLGANYLLGPPSNPTWHGFTDFYWAKGSWTTIVILPKNKVSPEWMDIWGEFCFFGEPAQSGDQLTAFVGDIVVGEYVAGEAGWYDLRIFIDDPLTGHADGAPPGDLITFLARRRATGRVYPVEIVQGVPRWTYGGDRIRVDINAVPETSTITLFGLTGLLVLLARRRTCRV